jgi:hypothetical protein
MRVSFSCSLFASLSVLLLWGSRAHAYTISSAVSEGCHERITGEALRRVRGELETAAPLPTTRNERALIADLPFEVADDMDDLGGATLLAAVRDNDLKGRQSVDLAQLALVHGDPEGQREHCLRGPAHVEPNGSEAAVAECRAFMRERLEQALDGLDEAGRPDPAKRTKLPLFLALRHRVEPALPTFYVRMGQALHALEDSFTHAYRTPDGMRITVVSDWLREVAGDLDERRHGPPHAGELDHCDDLDALRMQRRALATDAVAETLRAALDPAQTREQKLGSFDAILDKYLSYEGGCTFENKWCDAPEKGYGNRPSLKCSFGDSGSGALPLLLLLVWLPRARKRPRRGHTLTTMTTLAFLSMMATGASAEGPEKSDREDRMEKKAEQVESQRELTDTDDKQLVFGGYAGGGGSVDHGALAISLGARARLRKNWVLGADAEWNPWFSDPRVIYNTEHFRPGVFNFSLVGMFRLPLQNEDFNLRASAGLGFSTMLMDLYAAPRGSTGVFAAVSPLALEWKMARVPYLIITPLSIVLPAPQLNGVPFVYTQYRFTIGVELYVAQR